MQMQPAVFQRAIVPELTILYKHMYMTLLCSRVQCSRNLLIHFLFVVLGWLRKSG